MLIYFNISDLLKIILGFIKTGTYNIIRFSKNRSCSIKE